MNLSIRSNANTHNRDDLDRIDDGLSEIRRARDSRNNFMSLRELFATNGRDDSLRLEDLTSPSCGGGGAGGVEKEQNKEEQDAGLAAAMSIARLFVSDPHRSSSKKARRRSSQLQYEDMTPEGLEEQDSENSSGSSAASTNSNDSNSAPNDGEQHPSLDESRLRKVLDKINAMRAEHDEKLRRERLRADDLERENEALRARLRRATSDVDDRHSMSEYAKLITEQHSPSGSGVSRSGGNVVGAPDSQYVLKLQAQLCRALHKMGVLTNQIELMERQADVKVKDLQSQLVEQGNESFRAEVDHMNDLLEMEKEMVHMKEEHESQSSVQQGTIVKMEVELELERSLRCDALSYVRRTKEEIENASSGNVSRSSAASGGTRRGGRRAKRRSSVEGRGEKSKRMSKRDSEMSDATALTAVMANTSDHDIEHRPVGVDREGTYEQEVNFGFESSSDEDDEREQRRNSGGISSVSANERDEEAQQDATTLRSRLEESRRTVEELRAQVAEQRRTIERLALDHREESSPPNPEEVAMYGGRRSSA